MSRLILKKPREIKFLVTLPKDIEQDKDFIYKQLEVSLEIIDNKYQYIVKKYPLTKYIDSFSSEELRAIANKLDSLNKK